MNQFLDLLRKGKAVANPEAWKTRQNVINSLTVILSVGLTVAQAQGLNIQIDTPTLTLIASGIVSVLGIANTLITTISSTKAALLPAKKVK